jgi:very-short-patch-repair endonuclease
MRNLHDTRLVSAFASEHKGLIRTSDLHDLGFEPANIHSLTENGLLVPQYMSVYAVGHTALTQPAKYLAAAWAVGDEGSIAHHSAAAHLRLARPGGKIHVVVPTYNGHPDRGDIKVHRQRLRPEETFIHDGVPCTTVPRTVMDIAASAPKILESVFEEAQVRWKLQPAFLAAQLVTRPFHRGTARLRLLLEDAVDPGDVESILELRFLGVCEAFSLGRPRTQVWFGDYRVDFFFEEHGLVVETDGRRWHATAAKRRHDKAKDAYLRSLGLTVLHERWADVVDTPAAVAHRVSSNFVIKQL